jgi:hypothetical protein
VLILAIIAIFVFKQPFTRFLDRARKIGKSGIETTIVAQGSGVEVKPSPASEHLKAFDNALLLQRENFIKAELERLQINSGPDRERILIGLLPGLAVVQGFERTYTLIWGSQIFAFQFLNSAGSVNSDLLRPWYDQAAAREPHLYAVYTFDQWLGFLQVSLFVLRAGYTCPSVSREENFLSTYFSRVTVSIKGGLITR